MTAKKQTQKVTDLKPRGIKRSSKEVGKVRGGKASKVSVHDISFTHNVDKSSPKLF
ncbi:MAG: type VI secretion system tube protein Hcp [Gemmatimonadota bacterium]